MLALLIGMISSALATPYLQRVVSKFFNDPESLSTLRTLLGDTGSALIGAAAIAFSLVVFAMQINVERMPHGLFKRLSSDTRLLGSFLGSFLIALIVSATSLIPNGSWAALAIVTALWGTTIISLLFLYAYRRALKLINPIEQLEIMSRSAQRDLRRWAQLAEKATTLENEELQPTADETGKEPQFRTFKAKFFQANSHWTRSAEQATHYAISYAKRFAGQGDYEVAEYALTCIMHVNATYCAAKLGTFVGSSPLFQVPGTTDGFINSSLEQMRQTMQAALAIGDERMAASTLRAIGGLYGVYLKIDYPGRNRGKYHALLAAGYMGSAVESIIPHNMPDLMMEGIRLMGRASRVALDHTDPVEIIGIAEKIAQLSVVGALRTDHQPVTLTAFEQLSDITFDLLVKGKQDSRFPIHQLRSAVTAAAKRFLETPDTALNSRHQTTLNPYFSSASFSSLRARLTTLTDQLLDAPEDHLHAREIINNIEVWADQMYITQKELLLLAVQKRSSFAFDAISWATGISELLNALSNAPACTQHQRDSLRKSAIWLVSTLSWLPNDEESITFAENYSITESLFEAASDGLQRDCFEFYESCKLLLMAWAKKGGAHQTGWGILETALSGLVALAISEGNPASVVTLKAQLREMLTSEGAPPSELRARAAARLIKKAKPFHYSVSMHSKIESALAQLDHNAVQALVSEIAEILTSSHPGQSQAASTGLAP